MLKGRILTLARRMLFFFQAEDGIRDGRVTGVQTCALPIYAPGQKLASVVALSRGPKKIDSPLGALTQLFHIHRCERYTHLGGPNMMFRVDASCVLEAGIPRGVVKRVPGLVDFQIDPLIVRGYLKLKIMIHTLGLRVQENFNDVTIPKLPALGLRIFALISIQRIVTAGKRKVDVRFPAVTIR